MPIIVLDSNIIISALIKDSFIRNILTNFNINFVFPQNGLEEIYSCKKEILKKTNMNEKEFNVLLLRLLKYIQLIPLDILADFRYRAQQIIGQIDKDDVIFIATALALNCPIWSDNKHFQKQKEIKIFTTKNMIKFYEC